MKFRLIVVFIALAFSAFSQPNLNLESLSNVEVGETGNDIWGFVDDNGIEYAVMGSQTATRIFSLEDKANPIERAVISGASSIWRDIKHFDNYLYVTTDQGSDGLLIIDMTGAPDVIEHKFWQPMLDVGDGPQLLERCHNLYVDAEDGWCYLAGCNIGVGGVVILDVHTDPLNPIYVGATNEFYSHDVVTRGDTIYSSEISAGHFSIYVAEDKSNPIRTHMQNTTSNFTHNAWPSDDGKFLFTTDERANANLDSYDITDPNNIQLLDAFKPLETEGQAVIPHNTHYDGGFLVTSWYTDGVVIIDGNKPDNLIKVGAYDTFLGPNGNFNGCWGVYPYLPSGTIIASDMQTGLHVFSSTVQRACYLEGNVVDADTGSPIVMARVNIEADQLAFADSDAAGRFKTGLATAGNYTITASKPGYITGQVEVELVNGEVTDVTIELQKLPIVQFVGNVVTAADGSAIEGAQVVAISDTGELITSSAADGTFTFDLFEEPYVIYAGAWGYNEKEIAAFDPTSASTLEFRLDLGYKDDFVVDQGWIVTGDAETGAWVREEPVGTNFQGNESNPDLDSQLDMFGDQAYITGNGGGGAGFDDVDTGTTTLTSKPMDLSNMLNPTITFVRWFVNGGGQGEPNDALRVILSDGVNTIEVTTIDESLPVWFPESIEVAQTGLDLSQITIAFETSDFEDSGHLVEAGIDQFLVFDGVVSTNDLTELVATFSPNPFNDYISVSTEDQDLSDYTITDALGKVMLTGKLNGTETIINTKNLIDGVYFIQLNGNDVKGLAKKIIKF